LNVVKQYKRKLLNGEIPVWDLIVRKHLSKDPKRYRQKVSQVIAAEQLMKEGAQISAGQNLRFIFTSASNKRYERRVLAEELIGTNTNFDVQKYLSLLYSVAANLLSSFGYTARKVQNRVKSELF
jgi:DNA polymerase elongation subunit (family B)